MGINFVVSFNLVLSSGDVVISNRLEGVLHPIYLLLAPSIHSLEYCDAMKISILLQLQSHGG